MDAMAHHSGLTRAVQRFLAPWYDPQKAQAASERSEAIRLRSIAARIRSEEVRAAYAASAQRTPAPRR